MKVRVLVFLLIPLLTTACGVNQAEAEREFEAELAKISDPVERQRMVSDAYGICGDLGFIQDNSGMSEARKFRAKVNFTPVQRAGTRAICPQYW